MRREFAITPPDLRLVMIAPAFGLVAGLVGIGFAAREQPLLWLALIPVALVIALLSWSLRRRHVILDGRQLRIAAALHSTTVAVDQLDLDAARIVDLREEAGLVPRWKTFGTAVHGFRGGHFRLRNRSRAFALLTDRQRVLALPERSGRMLLLSLERPQALLDALRVVAERGRRR
jgi:hypothetical protein